MFEKIKEKIRVVKEKKEFLNQVNENTKSIRRKAYYEQKKQQAIEEGRILAAKELEKQRQDLKKEQMKTEGMDFEKKDIFGTTQDWNFLPGQLNKSRRKKNGR